MTDNQLRKLQLLELNILKQVVSICNTNNLKYFLAEGTLLGAVRHAGFIPWDDDLDMCMPREDFERLAEIAERELPESYTCRFCHDTDIWGTMRISDENYKVLRKMDNKELPLYVSIDIFPIDGFPQGQIRGKFHWMRCLYRFAIFKFSQFEQINKNKKRGIVSHFAIVFAEHIPFWKLFNKQKNLKKLTDVLKSCPYSDSEDVFIFYSEYNEKTVALPKTIMPKKYYGNGLIVPFENEYFVIPEDAKKILELEYGDYMTPPPQNERKEKHNLMLVD